MKKMLSLILCVAMIALCASLIAPIFSKGTEVSAATVEDVKENVNEARFLNMLNHNFVYNTDFDSVDAIVNDSVLALLDLRDAQNEDYIAEMYVRGFVKDMYGIEIEDMSNLNSEYEQIEGFVYIIPRGYTSYEHSIVSVQENEDGSFTVVSEVAINDHDASSKTQKVVSLFVENEESSFGYNMIYSNIMVETTDI